MKTRACVLAWIGPCPKGTAQHWCVKRTNPHPGPCQCRCGERYFGKSVGTGRNTS